MTSHKSRVTDILVVGAGIVGLSAAYAALNRGFRVTVIDRREPVSGASASNLGQISLADREESIELPWVYRTLELYSSLEKQSEKDLSVRQSGGLALLYTRREMEKAEDIVRKKSCTGLNCELLRGHEVNRQEPHIDTGILSGAVYTEKEGVLDPLAINYALLDLVRNMGSDVYANTEITSFESLGGKTVFAVSKDKSFQADKIIICTGAWSRDTARAAGIDIPVGYVRASALVTQPVPPMIRGAIAPGGFLTREITGGELCFFGAVQEKRGGIIFAQANREGKKYNTDFDIECATGPSRLFLKHFPAAAPFQVLRGWSGVTPYTPDEMPIFGYLPGSSTVFFMCGLKGAYSTALAAGEDAAAWLAGETGSDIIPEKFKIFSPGRFRQIQNQGDLNE